MQVAHHAPAKATELIHFLQQSCGLANVCQSSSAKAARPSAGLQAALVRAQCTVEETNRRILVDSKHTNFIESEQVGLAKQLDSLIVASLPPSSSLIRAASLSTEGSPAHPFPAILQRSPKPTEAKTIKISSSELKSSVVPFSVGASTAAALIKAGGLPASCAPGFVAWRFQDTKLIGHAINQTIGLPLRVGDVLLACGGSPLPNLDAVAAGLLAPGGEVTTLCLPDSTRTWFVAKFNHNKALELTEKASAICLKQAALQRSHRAAVSEAQTAARALAAVRQAIRAEGSLAPIAQSASNDTAGLLHFLQQRQVFGRSTARRLARPRVAPAAHPRLPSVPLPVHTHQKQHVNTAKLPPSASSAVLEAGGSRAPAEGIGSQYDRDDRQDEVGLVGEALQAARKQLDEALRTSPVIEADARLQHALSFRRSADFQEQRLRSAAAQNADALETPLFVKATLPQTLLSASTRAPLPDFVYTTRIDCVASVLGHRKPAYCVVHDHGGKCIVTGSDDKSIKVWDANTSQLLLSLRGFTAGHVSDLSVNADNTLIAAATDASNGLVRIWRLRDGVEHSVMRCHCAGVNYVSFHPTDPSLLITAADDGTAVVTRVLQHPKLHAHPSSSEHAGTPVVGSSGALLSDVPTSELESLAGGPVTKPEEAWFCCHDGGGFVAHDIQQAQDTSGKRVHVLTLVIHPLGGCFVTGGDDGLLRVWEFLGACGDTARGATRNSEARVSFVRAFQAHNGKVTTLSFSSSGQFLVSGCLDDSAAQLWTYNKTLAHWVAIQLHTATGEGVIEDYEVDRSGKKRVLKPPGIHDAKFTADEKHVITSQSWRPPGAVISEESDSEDEQATLFVRIKVWHCMSGQLVATFTGHSREVNVVLPSPVDPTVVLTGGTDGRINLWRIPTGKPQPHKNVSSPLPLRSWRLRKCRQLLSDEGLPLQAAVAQEAALGAVQLPMTHHQAEVWPTVHNSVLDASWGVDGLSFVVVDMDGRLSTFGIGALQPGLLTDWTRSKQIAAEAPSACIGDNRTVRVHSGYQPRERGRVAHSTALSTHLAMLAPFVQFTNRDDEQLVADAQGLVVERTTGLQPSQIAADVRTSNLYSEPYLVLAAPLVATASPADGRASDVSRAGQLVIGISTSPQETSVAHLHRLLPAPLLPSCVQYAQEVATAARTFMANLKPQSESALLGRQRARLQCDTQGCRLDSVAAGTHAAVILKAVTDALTMAKGLPLHAILDIPELRFVQRASGETTAVRISSSSESAAAPSSRGGVKASAAVEPPSRRSAQQALQDQFSFLKPPVWSAVHRSLGSSTCWENAPRELAKLVATQQREAASNSHQHASQALQLAKSAAPSARQPRSPGMRNRSRRARRPPPQVQYLSDSEASDAADDARVLQAAQAGINRFQRSLMRQSAAALAQQASGRRSGRRDVVAAVVESDSSSEEEAPQPAAQQLVIRAGAVADFSIFDDATQGKSIDREAAAAAAHVRVAYRGRSEWLMRTRPTPGAYVPQLGDQVVYCPAAHAEAMGVNYEASLGGGEAPAMRAKRRRGTVVGTAEPDSSKNTTLFPWQRWPSHWGLLQCIVVHVEYVSFSCEYGVVTLAECTLKVCGEPQIVVGSEASCSSEDSPDWNAPVSMEWKRIPSGDIESGLLSFKVRYSAVGGAPWVAIPVEDSWSSTDDTEVPAFWQTSSGDKASYAVGGDFIVLQSRVDTAFNAASAWLSGLAATDSLKSERAASVAEHLDNRLAVTTAWLSDPLSDYTEADRYGSFGGCDAVVLCAPGRHGTADGAAPPEPPQTQDSQRAHIMLLTHKSALQVCDGFVLTCPGSEPGVLDLNYCPVRDVNTPVTEVHRLREQATPWRQLRLPPIPIARSKLSGTASDVWRSATMLVAHLRNNLKLAIPDTLAELTTTEGTVPSPQIAASGAGETFEEHADACSPALVGSDAQNQAAALQASSVLANSEQSEAHGVAIAPIDPLAKKSGLHLHMGSMCRVLAPREDASQVPVRPVGMPAVAAAVGSESKDTQTIGGTKRTRNELLDPGSPNFMSGRTADVVCAFQAILRRPHRSLQVMFGPESGTSGALTDDPTSEKLSPWEVMPLWCAPTVQHVTAASAAAPSQPDSFEEAGRYQGFLSSKRSRSQFDTAWDTRFDRLPGLSLQQQGRVLFCAQQLASHPNAEDFQYDPDVRTIPGYDQIVLVPMSLQRIAQRTLRGYYRSLASFVHDCILLVANCDRFNQAGSEITQASRGIASALLLAAGVEPQEIPLIGRVGIQALRDFGLVDAAPEDSASEFEEDEAEPVEQEHDSDAAIGVQFYQGVQLQALPQRGLRRQEFVGALSRIIGNASQLDSSGYFDDPVDEDVYTDYRDSVSHPMCLEDVRKRLKVYNSVQEAAADLMLIYDNAMAYNPKGHPVHQLALQIKLDMASELHTAQLQLRTPLDAGLPPLPEPGQLAASLGLQPVSQAAAGAASLSAHESPQAQDSDEYSIDAGAISESTDAESQSSDGWQAQPRPTRRQPVGGRRRPRDRSTAQEGHNSRSTRRNTRTRVSYGE